MNEELIGIDDPIVTLLTKMQNMEVGSEEHKRAAEELERLYKVRLEEQKAYAEYDLKQKQFEADQAKAAKELELKETQAKHEKTKTIVETVATGAMVAAYVGLNLIGFKFEETGSIRSTTHKNILRDVKLPRFKV